MNRMPSPAVRRLVLGGALLAATLVAFLPDTAPVRAATPAKPLLLAQAEEKSAAGTAAEAARAAREAARTAADEARSAARERRKAKDLDIDIDFDADKPEKGLRIGVAGVDRQYDSFDQFLDRDPALASMVLGIVFIVFLTPILIIGLIIWYKMRKNREQNEMMLKLAERGIVPASGAMQAVAADRVEATIASAASTLPLPEQAAVLGRRAAWSDLRKGILMGAVGLAFTLYGLAEDGGASWVGLTLLFVGIGYIVLWYFEDRQAAAVASFAGTNNQVPARSPGDKPN